MSDTVERLARRRVDEGPLAAVSVTANYDDVAETANEVARWWLRAIAEELSAEGKRLLEERGEHFVGRYESAKWLRKQADG